MPKYAPPNADGLKPWLVTVSEWGRKTTRVIYAESNSAAVYEAKGRMRYVHATARRATPADMPNEGIA